MLTISLICSDPFELLASPSVFVLGGIIESQGLSLPPNLSDRVSGETNDCWGFHILARRGV